MTDGDAIRWYVNPGEYITGVIVEDCGDGTFWVEHSNGQQRHYKESELVLDLGEEQNEKINTQSKISGRV